MGYQGSLKLCASDFELSSQNLNTDTTIDCHSGVFQARRFSNVCAIHRIDVKLGVPPARLVNIKDPTMSFLESRRAVASTLDKLQITASTAASGLVFWEVPRHQVTLLAILECSCCTPNKLTLWFACSMWTHFFGYKEQPLRPSMISYVISYSCSFLKINIY